MQQVGEKTTLDGTFLNRYFRRTLLSCASCFPASCWPVLLTGQSSLTGGVLLHTPSWRQLDRINRQSKSHRQRTPWVVDVFSAHRQSQLNKTSSRLHLYLSYAFPNLVSISNLATMIYACMNMAPFFKTVSPVPARSIVCHASAVERVRSTPRECDIDAKASR